MARNPGLARDISNGSEYRRALLEVAEACADGAREASPVADGDYRDGIEATTADREGEVVGRVNANDWKSHWIEWGSVNNPPHAPLRRGVLSAGLTFEEERGG